MICNIFRYRFRPMESRQRSPTRIPGCLRGITEESGGMRGQISWLPQTSGALPGGQHDGRGHPAQGMAGKGRIPAGDHGSRGRLFLLCPSGFLCGYRRRGFREGRRSVGIYGDTGYSKVEGTTGNFPVHLHLGIYLVIGDQEISVNPYYPLRYVEDRRVKCAY